MALRTAKPRRPRRKLTSSTPAPRPPAYSGPMRSAGFISSLRQGNNRTSPYLTGPVRSKLGLPGGGAGLDQSSGYDPYPGYSSDIPGLLAALAARRDAEISGYRSNFETQMEKLAQMYAADAPVLKRNYDTATASASAVNDAVANRLKQQGTEATQSVTEKLKQISADPGLASQVAQNYQGAQAADYAMDAGDVQRLITRLAEEQQVLQKAPGLARQEGSAQLNQIIAQLQKDYAEQEFGLRREESSNRRAYDMEKFQYEQGQKAAAEDRKAAAEEKAAAAKSASEDRYWENYWKQRDEMERRWEFAQTIGDKAAQRRYEAQMKALDRKADMDIANIRAGASVSSATISAEATKAAAKTRAKAGGKGKGKGAGGKSGDVVGTAGSAKRARVIKEMQKAVFTDPSLSKVRYIARYGEGNVNQALDAALISQGVDPSSALGKQLKSAIKKQMKGKPVVSGGQKVPNMTYGGKKKKKR